MEPYAGFEPQVGEISALRTFRIGPDGVLYALFSDVPWQDGTNTAHCAAISPIDAGTIDHAVPEPDCTCGFYAYASPAAAEDFAHARHVLAVVRCWGRVIAGTRGIRAEYAHIDAIWLSPRVPADLAEQVRDRYPTARMYTDKKAMLEGHPPTALDCYEPVSRADRTFVKIGAFFVGIAVIVGLLPAHWLGGTRDAHLVWMGGGLLLLLAAAVIGRRRTAAVARRYSIILSAVALWLLAPLGGVAGVLLLRLPLLQVFALLLAQHLRLSRSARTFPARVT